MYEPFRLEPGDFLHDVLVAILIRAATCPLSAHAPLALAALADIDPGPFGVAARRRKATGAIVPPSHS